MIVPVLQILVRVGLAVSANAVQKRLVRDGFSVVRLWLLTHAWMLVPAVLLAGLGASDLPAPFWRDAACAGGLDVLGNLAMVAALRSTDLSIFGPLNALRPILALGFGWLFLGETPTPIGAAGVVLTVAGAAVLLGENRPGSRSSNPGRTAKVVLLRVAGLSFSTLGAALLKRAAVTGSVGWTVAVWVAAGGAVVGVIAWIRRQAPGKPPDRGMETTKDTNDADQFERLPLYHRVIRGIRGSFSESVAGVLSAAPSHGPSSRVAAGWVALHVALFLAMVWITVDIFQRTLLAYSFVYFQLGMVLQVIVGRVCFGEPAFARRLFACMVMAAGGGLVLWRG